MPEPDRDREIRRGDLFQIELDHHVFGNLPALRGTILQATEALFHLGNAGFESCCQRFIGECRTDNSRDDFVQVGEALDGVSEGLLVEIGVLSPDAVAEDTIVMVAKLNWSMAVVLRKK